MLRHHFCYILCIGGGSEDMQWCFSQVKGAIDDDVAEGKTHTWGFQSSVLGFGRSLRLVLVLGLESVWN